MTYASHDEKLNLLSTYLYDYWLRRPPSDDVYSRKGATIVDALLPRDAIARERGNNFDPNTTQRTPSGWISPRMFDDDAAWASVPALGKHLRECICARQRNGIVDKILVEFTHRDNRYREDNKMALFYVLVERPREGDYEFERFIGTCTSHHLARQCLRGARGRANDKFIATAEVRSVYGMYY